MIEKEILNLLVEIRKQGIRQCELVAKAEMTSEARLSRILRGHTWPTDEEILRICRILNVSPDYLEFDLENK